MEENKKETWKDIKAILVQKDTSELLKLIADLYSLNKANKSFLHARYSTGEKTLEPYYGIISDALYPDVCKNKPVRVSVGKKAISDYFKATKDRQGKIELMVHYVELGTRYTTEYGDMDENFYFGLESMFQKILQELGSEPEDVVNIFMPRLEDVAIMAGKTGWGYKETLDEMLGEYYDINGR